MITLARRRDLLANAAANQRPVEITYRCEKDGQDIEVRVVEIHEIWLSLDGEWCIRAYCRLRDEMRTFRIDRILAHRTRRLVWRGKTPTITPLLTMLGTPTKTAYDKQYNLHTAGSLIGSARAGIRRAAVLDALRGHRSAGRIVELTYTTGDYELIEEQPVEIRDVRKPTRGNNWIITVRSVTWGEIFIVHLRDVVAVAEQTESVDLAA
jgi:hypothetical protein